MSDELLFDSERQARRARRKARLIPIIVLAAVLVLVVVIALLIRSGKAEIHNAGENTLYPFTWYTESDGRLVLELPHRNAPEYRWTPVGEEAFAFLRAERPDADKDGTTRITLTPTAEGRTVLELALLRPAPEPAAAETPAGTAASGESGTAEAAPPEEEAEPDDVIYRTMLQLENREADGRLVCTLLSVSGYQLQPQLSGGEDSDNPYKVRTDENRELVISIQVSGLERDWSCEIVSGEESVIVDGILNAPEGVELCLKSGEQPGESELLMRSEAANAELRFRCRTEADGALLLIDRQENYGEKPEAPNPAELVEAIATVPSGEEHEGDWEGVPETKNPKP